MELWHVFIELLRGSNLVPLPAARGYHIMNGTERQKLVLEREIKLQSCSRLVGSCPSQEHFVWDLMWQLLQPVLFSFFCTLVYKRYLLLNLRAVEVHRESKGEF